MINQDTGEQNEGGESSKGPRLMLEPGQIEALGNEGALLTYGLDDINAHARWAAGQDLVRIEVGCTDSSEYGGAFVIFASRIQKHKA